MTMTLTRDARRTIGQQARDLLADFMRRQEIEHQHYKDSVRPACKNVAVDLLKVLEPMILNAASNGNHYVMYHGLASEPHVKVVVEELVELLPDCAIAMETTKLRIAWK